MLPDVIMYPEVSQENLHGFTRRSSPVVMLPPGHDNSMVKRRIVVMPDTVFVGNLKIEMKAQQVEDIFSRFGKVKRVEIAVCSNGISRGFGFVIFYDKMALRKVEQDCTLAEEHSLITAQAVQMVAVPCQQVGDGPTVQAQQYTPAMAPLSTTSSSLQQYCPPRIPHYYFPQYVYPRQYLYYHAPSPPYPQQQHL